VMHWHDARVRNVPSLNDVASLVVSVGVTCLACCVLLVLKWGLIFRECSLIGTKPNALQ